LRLKDEVAIVTGGGGGIGEGICDCLAHEGAHVVVSDIRQESAEKVAEKIKKWKVKSLSVKTDVRNANDCQALVDRALKDMGRIDILICCAGVDGLDPDIDSPGMIENISEENWDLVVDVNLKGVFLCNRTIAPYFKKEKKGRIINISSTLGRSGIEWLPHYCATKAGIIVMTQAISTQLAPYSVTVNTICPGMVWTPLWNSGATALSRTYPHFKDMGPEDIFNALVEETIPLKKAPTPEDIGKMVIFLSSADGARITGQAINIDGGVVFN